VSLPAGEAGLRRRIAVALARLDFDVRRLSFGRVRATAAGALVVACLAAGPAHEARATTTTPTKCVKPGVYFNGVRYERRRLERAFLRVERLLGQAHVYGGACCDVTPCPPSPPPPQLRVFSVFGVSPRAAVSAGGSSRAILIAGDRCKGRVRERALLRCLRRVRA
jgi:hypothetical protein